MHINLSIYIYICLYDFTSINQDRTFKTHQNTVRVQPDLHQKRLRQPARTSPLDRFQLPGMTEVPNVGYNNVINHRKTIGKPLENGGLIGFYGILNGIFTLLI